MIAAVRAVNAANVAPTIAQRTAVTSPDDEFLKEAEAAELAAQELLAESGLGQPPGRWIGDFEDGAGI